MDRNIYVFHMQYETLNIMFHGIFRKPKKAILYNAHDSADVHQVHGHPLYSNQVFSSR